MDFPAFDISAIELYERPVRLRLPFRFGVVTLTHAPQAFARVHIRLADGRESSGAAAELLAPKWFDKTLALTNDDNFDQLRDSCHGARAHDLADRGPRTAFGHFAARHGTQQAAGAARGLNPLVAGFGPALIDRAVLDALCRHAGLSFAAAMRRNLAGIVANDLAPDLAGFDVAAFLGQLQAVQAIDARHTVGLVDPITAADQKAGARVADGLPETLEEVVGRYHHRWFKLKVQGDIGADLDRLTRIAAVLDKAGTAYHASLDGNEQYDDIDAVIALWRRITETPALAKLAAAIAFIEQPVNRKTALARDVTKLSDLKPVIIDESDDTLDAFRRAKALGYRGVSSKTCKNLYRSILNACRCAAWNAAPGAARYFMSGEDLTTQAGLAVQQDLALVAFLGLGHVERNGHHYVDGFRGAPAAEQQAFLAAHPTLYHRAGDVVRLTIADGRIDLSSFERPGFAAGAEPDWTSLTAMPEPNRIYPT
ncbi:MAG: mandelate racemase [Proteobacteria bacterium]|nr:mandelate racemase [Pseudomonadota bacterium]